MWAATGIRVLGAGRQLPLLSLSGFLMSAMPAPSLSAQLCHRSATFASRTREPAMPREKWAPARSTRGGGGDALKHIVASTKTVTQAVADLEASVKANGFGVLHIYDLKQTLESKGAPIDNECQILEICNPHEAKKVLTEDMDMNMALPCRLSVYQRDNQTRIGMISPKAMLTILSDSPALAKLAGEVEDKIKKMIDEAK